MHEPQFQLNFIGREQHMMLPTVTSIILTQNLYEILFQYVITEEKEEQLKEFISLLENHIKSKSQGPFSRPLSELAFLEEGLEELKLLNWLEIPVGLFEIKIDGTSADQEISEKQLEEILDLLPQYLTFNRKGKSNQIYVYPQGLVY